VTAAPSKNIDIKQTSANIRVAQCLGLRLGKPRLNIRLALATDELEFGIYVTCLCCVECIKVSLPYESSVCVSRSASLVKD